MGALYHAEQVGWQIVRSILNSVRTDSSFTAPDLARTIKSTLEPALAKHRSVREIQRTIYYMKRRGLLSFDDQKQIAITPRGYERLNELASLISPLQLRHGEKWDGRWRVVTFDIPEDKRQARDALRRVIKQLGFVQLQRSVWAHPLPCKKYFEEIQDAYGVQDHILYLEVAKPSNEKQLLKLFSHIID